MLVGSLGTTAMIVALNEMGNDCELGRQPSPALQTAISTEQAVAGGAIKAGGTVGSVKPGIGTAIGAVVGATIFLFSSD